MTDKPEKLSWLGLMPVFATLAFYGLPGFVQQNRFVQFLPQVVAYLSIGIWARYNSSVFHRLGLRPTRLWSGIGWGALTGLALGICNSFVILWVVPRLGGNIAFLQETPHGQVPILLMVPWVIVFIAVFVEINFRGFLLGRLATLFGCSMNSHERGTGHSEQFRLSPGLAAAIGSSTLIFAFDPFMVSTFRHLHWIAVWDGLIWGWMRMRLRNLYSVITAHAVEVVILYLWVRAALT